MLSKFLSLLGFKRYGRKSQHITIWYMVKGLIPWMIILLAGAAISMVMLVATRTILIPFVIIAPWMGAWIGGMVAWMSGIQKKISQLAAERRIIVSEIDLPGGRKLGFLTILNEQPKPHITQSRMVGKTLQRYIEMPYDEMNLRRLGLEQHYKTLGFDKYDKKNGKILIPVNPYNYELSSMFYLTIRRFRIDTDRITVSLKQPWEDLPLTEESVPIPFANWYGEAVIPVLNLCYELHHNPEGLDQKILLKDRTLIKANGQQEVLLKDKRDITDEDIQEHQERMNEMNEEFRDALTAIMSPEISERVRLEHVIGEKNNLIENQYRIIEDYKKGDHSLSMELKRQHESIRHLGGPLLTKKKLLGIIILIVILIVLVWWLT